MYTIILISDSCRNSIDQKINELFYTVCFCVFVGRSQYSHLWPHMEHSVSVLLCVLRCGWHHLDVVFLAWQEQSSRRHFGHANLAVRFLGMSEVVLNTRGGSYIHKTHTHTHARCVRWKMAKLKMWVRTSVRFSSMSYVEMAYGLIMRRGSSRNICIRLSIFSMQIVDFTFCSCYHKKSEECLFWRV